MLPWPHQGLQSFTPSPTLSSAAVKMAGLVTAQPFADGVARAAKFTSRRLQAAGASEGDEFLMQPMAVSAHTIQVKVSAVHGHRMAGLARRCSGSSGGAGATHPGGGCSSL